MNYLLDVNALIAWEHPGSPHHAAFHAWAARVGSANFRTCCLVELGFLRVSTQVFGYSLAHATAAVTSLKRKIGGFIEVAPTPRLAPWAATAVKTTNAYLAQLARNNELRLATFDSGIRDSIVELLDRRRFS